MGLPGPTEDLTTDAASNTHSDPIGMTLAFPCASLFMAFALERFGRKVTATVAFLLEATVFNFIGLETRGLALDEIAVPVG